MTEFESILLAVAFWAFWFKKPIAHLIEQLARGRFE